MIGGDSYNVARAPRAEPPIASLCLTAAITACGLALAATVALSFPAVPLILFGAIIALAVRGLRQSYPHQVLGFCNIVTLFRAALVAFLAGAVFDPTVAVWLVFWIATLAFALDGLDGWLARRSGLTSPFGARFDMETDALLGAVLALWLLAMGRTGPEILVLGFMRYAFCAAATVLPALRAELPQSLRRKTVCVIQVTALIAILCPLTPAGAVLPVSFCAALLLSWSFAVDIRWLIRRSQ